MRPRLGQTLSLLVLPRRVGDLPGLDQRPLVRLQVEQPEGDERPDEDDLDAVLLPLVVLGGGGPREER